MKINSDLLIDSKVNGTFYANDFKCKNLAPATGTTSSQKGMNFINQNGIITASGTATDDVYYGLSRLIYVKAGITYTMSVNFLTYNGRFIYSNTAANIGLSYADLQIASGYSKTFTPTKDGFFDIVLYVHTGNGLNQDIKLQVEEGTSVTSWTPYKAFENNDIYSSTETRIGTWTDGKPLYRVVYETTTYSDNFSVPTPNIEKLIDIKGILQRSDYTNVWTPIPSRLENEGMKCNFGIITVGNNTSVTLIYGTNWSAAFRRIILILEYTKTTD